MTSSETWRNIGSKIRFIRKTSGLTLKQLARGCGLSANTISMVERNEVSPSIETICRIASALGVSPASLFLEICQPNVVLQRACEMSEDQNITQKTMQILSNPTRIPPGDMRSPQPISCGLPSSRSFILCISGQVELELEGQNYLLEPGDNLAFNSDAFHRWRSPNDTPGIAVMVLSD